MVCLAPGGPGLLPRASTPLKMCFYDYHPPRGKARLGTNAMALYGSRAPLGGRPYGRTKNLPPLSRWQQTGWIGILIWCAAATLTTIKRIHEASDRVVVEREQHLVWADGIESGQV